MGNDEGGKRRLLRSHRELEVWQRAFGASMHIFELTKSFPKEGVYALTGQARRSSRSVTVNLAEAWRKRRYQAAFVAKLSDAEAEAAETQDWIHYAVECGYLDREAASDLCREYEGILKTLVGMIFHASEWVLPPVSPKRRSGPESEQP